MATRALVHTRNPFDAAASMAVAQHVRGPLDEMVIDAFGIRRMPLGRSREMRDPAVRAQVASMRHVVYKANRFLGNWVSGLERTVARVSFEVDENGAEKKVITPWRDHRLSQILGKGAFAQPNPWTTAGNYLANISWDLGLTGNHYALKVRNPEEGNKVWWFIRLRPDWVKVIADEQNVGISGYVLRPTGATIGELSASFGDFSVEFDKKEILHIRGPNSTDDRIGLSPIRAMSTSVATAGELRDYNATFFEQGARIDGVIEGATSTQQVQQVYDMLTASHYAGNESAWLPLVLPSPYKFVPSQQTMKDMEWATLAGFSDEDVLEAYGVPRGLLGTVKDVNRANLAGLQIIAAQNGVLPITNQIEEAMEADCLNLLEEPAQTPDSFWEYEFENPSPADPELEITRRESQLKSGERTINELRTEDDMPPVDWGDSPWLPAQLIQPGDEEEIEVEDGDVVEDE